jgi:phosphoenolpyruvate carboxykinase (ATP)
VPKECPNVPGGVLDPRSTWRNPNAYDDKARELAGRFGEHFAEYGALAPELRKVAPQPA